MDFFISNQREKERTPLHPTTELSHASTELCDILAWRHLRLPLRLMCIYTPFIGKREIGDKTGNE